MKQKTAISAERIEEAIHEVRGRRVMLDSDLARFYGVETRILVRAVKRNARRFPEDFMFPLSNQEVAGLRSQSGISSRVKHGGRRTLPYAFTEHGAVMVASVLNSPPAVEMSIHVVRAFIHLRQVLEQHKDLSRELKALRKELEGRLDDQDEKFRIVRQLIDRLLVPPSTSRRRIGFRVG
jgi:hypothetical protein